MYSTACAYDKINSVFGTLISGTTWNMMGRDGQKMIYRKILLMDMIYRLLFLVFHHGRTPNSSASLSHPLIKSVTFWPSASIKVTENHWTMVLEIWFMGDFMGLYKNIGSYWPTNQISAPLMQYIIKKYEAKNRKSAHFHWPVECDFGDPLGVGGVPEINFFFDKLFYFVKMNNLYILLYIVIPTITERLRISDGLT